MLKAAPFSRLGETVRRTEFWLETENAPSGTDPDDGAHGRVVCNLELQRRGAKHVC